MPAKVTKKKVASKDKLLRSAEPIKSIKPRAMLLRLSDDSMLVIPDSEVRQLSALTFETRNEVCQVNNYKTKESMDKIIARLGWEVSVPGEESK